ncbi:phage tail tape measure protein [Streptomyces sp. NPDC021224]|uniref:phage tail tape measure protein n=1 Tax=unclassified Streptomyces TaxID=2593676 RepID=UPI0037ACBA50
MALRTTGVRYDLVARDSASKTFSRVGGSASKLERGLGKLAKAGLAAGAALAAGVAVGLADGTKKAVAFEAEMKKVQTQAGASAGDVAVLSKQVLELGKSTQQGPEKLAESLYHLKSVGMTNVEAMTALKTASDLAAVGGSDLEATTNALAGAWRTGIKGADNFGKTAATVNAIIGAGNMRMEDMVAALGTGILPTAKTFGLTFAQVGGALALFTDEGIDSASAATRLRMSISLLAAPSRAADKQLKTIGLTGNMLGQAMRSKDGIIGAIELLSEHLDQSGLDATHQAALLSRAFGGGKSSSAILSMVNNLDVLEKKQLQINNSMGKYGPAVEAQRKTAQAQFNLIKSNFEVFSIKAGNMLLPPVTQFTTYVNKTALPTVHRYSQELLGMVPVGKIKAGFGAASTMVSDFIDGLMPKAKKKPTLTVPTPQIKGPTIPPMLRRPYTFTVPSPQLKGAKSTIPDMIAAPKPKASDAKKLGAQIRSLISGGIGDAVKGIDWSKVGRTIGSGLATAVGWVGGHLADITKKITKALSKLDYVGIGKSIGRMAIPLAVGIAVTLFEPLASPSFWRKHWSDVILAAVSFIPLGKLAGPLAKVFEKLPILKWAVPLLKGVEKVGDLVGKGAGGVAKFFGKSLWKGLSEVFPEAAAVVERESGLLTTRLGSWAIDLQRAGQRAIRGLGDGIKSGTGWVIAKIGEGIGYILKPFTRSATWLLAAGGALVNGLLQGVGTSVLGVGQWLKAHLVDPIVGAVKSLFGIHSPSTIFAGIGGDLVRGLLSGITSTAAGIGKWLYSHLVSPILQAASDAGGWLYQRGKDVVSGLLGGVSSAASGLGDWVGDHLISPITGAFRGASGWLYQRGKDVMSGLLSGMQAGFKGVASFLGTVKRAVAGSSGSGGALGGKVKGFASGGLAPIGQTAWVGERGPELMQVTRQGTRIYSHADSMALARASATPLPGYAKGTSASSRVAAAERDLAYWRKRAAQAHTKAQQRADALEVQAAQKKLAAAKKLLTGTTSVSNSLANGFLKSLETGTAAGIASAIKSMNTKLQAAGAGSLVAGNLKTSSQLQALATKKASIAALITKANQFATDQANGLGDYLSISGTSASSVADLVAQMQRGQSTAGAFASEVSDLSKRGLSKTLLSQLADAGPGSQLAQILAGASRDDIDTLNRLATSQDKLTASFGKSMADAMYDSGAQAGKGFLAGLQAQEKALQAEMDRLAAGMVNTIKKKLGIHSPSTVARDQIGKQFALGAAVGVRLHAPKAAAEAQRMADTMTAVRARSAASGRSAGGDGGHLAALKALAAALAEAGAPEVHVHVADERLQDLIRVEVKKADSKAAFRAKVGSS